MSGIFLSLGSNLGERKENLALALKKISGLARLVKTSGIYESAPFGFTDQPFFLNICAEIETELPPPELLSELKQIEISMGRIKTARNGPRVIDLDIIFFRKQKIVSQNLTIPHARYRERLFVLLPLCEIADFVPPGEEMTLSVLCNLVTDQQCRLIGRI